MEYLLREFCGDADGYVDGDDFVALCDAIWTLVEEFVQYVLPDIYREYKDAYQYEFDHTYIAAPALTNRAMQVSVNPDGYCWYTREFIKALMRHWPELISWTPGE